MIETNASLWRKEPKRVDGRFCLVQVPVETPRRLTVTRIAVENSTGRKPVALVMLDLPTVAAKPSGRILRYVDVPMQELQHVAPNQRPERPIARSQSSSRPSALNPEVAVEQIVGLVLQMVRIL